MRNVPIYRALDRSNIFFGIQGSYLMYALVAIGAATVVGLFIGSQFHSGLITFVFGFGLAAIAYVLVLRFQSEHSEKERDQMIASMKLPDVIRVKPRKIVSMLSNPVKFK